MKAKTLIIPLLAMGLVVAVPTTTFAIVRSQGDTIVLDGNSFNDSYEFHSLLSMPNVEDTYFKKGSSICKATYGELIFPNGISKVPGTYELDIPGVYQIGYYDNNGNSYIKSFKVDKNVYERGKGVTANFANSLSLHPGNKGININLVSGSAFRFNKIVNLNNFADGIVDLGNFYPAFKNTINDVPAASFVTLKVVDAYDESKFVEFYMWSGSSVIPYYVGAGSSNQNLTGLEYNPTRPDKINCVYEGVSYNCHKISRYQSVEAYGVWTDIYANEDGFDVSSKRPGIIGTDGIGFNWNLSSQVVTLKGNNKLVTDLDAPEVYDSNILDFSNFFTTGEVYAQFEGFGFNAPSINLQVDNILGMRGDELLDATIVDTKAPDIVLDFARNGEDPITICKDKEFIIPKDVKVRDINYYGDIKTNIYYNYGQEDQISIYSTDTFTPKMLGTYSLVYKATDAYGNVATKVVDLNVVNRSAFSYQETKLNSINAAQVNLLPVLDVTSVNDPAKQRCFVVTPNGEKEELELDESGTHFIFVPLTLGEYEIVYELSNRYYSETFSYKLSASANNSVYFKTAPALYPAYIKNASYCLDPFYGLKATEHGGEEVLATPYVSYDGGSFTKIDNIDEFKITGNNSVQFKFTSGENEYTSPVIDIIDVSYGDKVSAKDYTKYFVGNYASAEIETDALSYSFTSVGSMKFANVISLSGFAFNSKVTNTSSDTFSLVIKELTNSVNEIKVTYEKVSGNAYYVSIDQAYNGEAIHKGALVVINKSTFDVKVSYNKGNLSIDGVGDFALTPMNELVTFAIENSGAIEYKVNGLNNQSFGSSGMKELEPQGHFSFQTGAYAPKEEATISPWTCSNVLNPILKSNIKVTVLDADGGFATSKDGIVLDNVDANRSYSFLLDKIGSYRVKYSVTFSRSERREFVTETYEDSFPINVLDTIAPEVRFSSSSDCLINAGTKIRIRDFTYSDNYYSDEELKAYIFVFDSHNNIIESGFNPKECSFFTKGIYRVVAYVYDPIGNVGTASYRVLVR